MKKNIFCSTGFEKIFKTSYSVKLTFRITISLLLFFFSFNPILHAQVTQFPQVYNNYMGDPSASNLNIRQSASISGTVLTTFRISSKIGAVAIATNSSDQFYNWIQVCLPSTSGSLTYGYIACNEFYARIDPTNNYATVTAVQLNIRPCAGCTSSWVTIGGSNALYGQNSIVALTGNVSNISGTNWYEVYLTGNCSQATGWLSGAFLSVNGSPSNYRTVGGRICNESGNCAFFGNVNAATIGISGIGTTSSSDGFYQYKLPINWSGTISCTHPNYNTSTPSFYSYTANVFDYSRNFQLSNGCPVPSAPASLTVQSTSSNSVTLSWSAVSGSGISYEVLKNNTSCVSAFGSSGLLTTSTGGTVSGLLSNTIYYFVVVARNSCGESQYSNCLSVQTGSSGCTTPDAPGSLTATTVSSGQINLSWPDNSSNETGFEIERATSAGGPFSGIATVGANTTSYPNTGLSSNTTYYYRVRACCNSFCSNYSNTASATTTSSGGFGSVTVTITPPGAVSAGAQWNIDGQLPWQNSGATIAAGVGNHTVNFNTISGYTSPASQNVTVTAGNTTSINVAYTGTVVMPTINSITFTNKIENHNGIEPLFTLYSGSAFVTNQPVKICADGSTSTYFKVNVSNTAGISFRILDENGNSISNTDKYGQITNLNIFGNNVEVAYKHPQYMDAAGLYRGLTLQVLYNNTSTGVAFPLHIYRAPVLMIHGWLGGLSSFETLETFLLQNNYIWPLTYRKVYPNSASFNDNFNVAFDGIIDLFNKARSGKISCGKVDIVAHSMGGLLSRLYLQSNSYKSDIHKLITLNTPHSGTQGANFIYSIGNIVCPLLEWLNTGDFICSPAIENMRVNSNSIRSQLNGYGLNRHVVPSVAISTSDVFAADVDCNSLGILLYANPDGLVNFLLIQSIFNFEDNDLVVPISSQRGGLGRYKHFNGQCHLKSTRNPTIMPAVANLLDAAPNSLNFDIDGYNPPILNSIYSSLNATNSLNSQTQSDTIEITSPQENSTFISGQIITVETKGSSNIDKTILAIGNGTIPLFTKDTISSTTLTNYIIPNTVSGKLRISCIGYDSVTHSYAIDTMEINVYPNASLDSIGAYIDTLRIPKGGSCQLNVIGYYNDGVSRDLYENDSLQYIVDTSLLKYLGRNKFHGISTGITSINVTFENKVKQVPVVIYDGEKIVSAIFNSDKKIICEHEAVTFKDLSLGNPVNRYWSFEGGVPSFSTEVSPTVQYLYSGRYKVKLMVNFANSADSLSIDSLIEVYKPNTTVTSGLWDNPLTWSCQTIPSANDTVTISSGHSIIMRSLAEIGKINIEQNATLSLEDSTARLTIGNTLSKKGSLECKGSVLIKSGELRVNGRLSILNSGAFNMTGGKIVIDGNTGELSTSVPDGQHLFDIATDLANFNFSGGLLQIINPPFGINSQAINCPFRFGPGTTLMLGDGQSVTGSNNPNGFGGNLLPAEIGKLIYDPVSTENNRWFKNLNPLTVRERCDVRSGNLTPVALFRVIDSLALQDADGNIYPVTTICNQQWLAKNLEVTHYRNGDSIPQVQDPAAWAGLTTGAWCYYANNMANGTVYGKLYNWYAVNDPRGLAPAGWHIPTEADWLALTDTCLGGENIAAGKMKSTGLLSNNTGLWLGSYNLSDNSSGFTGLPAGCRLQNGTFVNINAVGMWWTATPATATTARFREADQESNGIASGQNNRKLGMSVRCVKD